MQAHAAAMMRDTDATARVLLRLFFPTLERFMTTTLLP
jgi:hypothetical protein